MDHLSEIHTTQDYATLLARDPTVSIHEVAKKCSPDLALAYHLCADEAVLPSLLANQSLSPDILKDLLPRAIRALERHYMGFSAPIVLEQAIQNLARSPHILVIAPQLSSLFISSSHNRIRSICLKALVNNPRLPEHHLATLAEAAIKSVTTNYDHCIRIALHPSSTKKIRQSIIDYCPGPQLAEALCWSPTINQDPAHISWLEKYKPTSLEIQAATLIDEPPQEARDWIIRVMAEGLPSSTRAWPWLVIAALENLGPKVSKTISPKDLAPLLSHPNKAIRMATTSILGTWPKPAEAPARHI